MIPGQYDDSRTVLDTSYFQVCFQELNFRNVISGTIFQKQCFKNIISGTVFQEHILQEQYFRNNISGTVFQEQYFRNSISILADGFLLLKHKSLYMDIQSRLFVIDLEHIIWTARSSFTHRKSILLTELIKQHLGLIYVRMMKDMSTECSNGQ